ncbi:MAG: transposon-encoded TnpW family protein [Oscillospiraceae bacterium]|nr:transposon-encoded TnpW family protein [Oscillospiraceae bacterium]
MAKTKASQPTTPHTAPQSQRTLEKRIGHTTYEVHICFSERSKENMNDKICRLIKNQIADSQ